MTTIDRHRARLARARKRVEGLEDLIKGHLNVCAECKASYEQCDELYSLWCETYEAIGRRKEAESVLREEQRR